MSIVSFEKEEPHPVFRFFGCSTLQHWYIYGPVSILSLNNLASASEPHENAIGLCRTAIIGGYRVPMGKCNFILIVQF